MPLFPSAQPGMKESNLEPMSYCAFRYDLLDPSWIQAFSHLTKWRFPRILLRSGQFLSQIQARGSVFRTVDMSIQVICVSLKGHQRTVPPI